MKIIIIGIVLLFASHTHAAVIRGQTARELTAMLRKVNSVDLVAKDIRCVKRSNGIRVIDHTCDLKVQANKVKTVRITRSLAKNLWREVPGDAVKVGLVTTNDASVLRCYRIDKCDSLDLDCRNLETCTIQD